MNNRYYISFLFVGDRVEHCSAVIPVPLPAASDDPSSLVRLPHLFLCFSVGEQVGYVILRPEFLRRSVESRS